MSLNFTNKISIGGEGTPTLQFYDKGFVLKGSSGGEPTWQDIIISGNTALTLVNAKANGLNYVKLFGATEQSNLPSGYTQLRYVQNTTTTTKINTGVKPEVGDEIEIRFITPYTAATSNYLLQSRESNNAGIFGISGSQTGKTIILSWGTGNSVTSNITREYNHVYVVKASVIGTTLTLYVKDVTAGTEDTVTGTISNPSDAVTPYFIWGNTSQYLAQVTPIYYAKITNNGTTKLNYVASKDSNDSASFYNLVNNTFITNFDGTITGSTDVVTPSPEAPISLVSNNGVIKVSNNLFSNDITFTSGALDANSGQPATSSISHYTSAIPVKIGKTYTFSLLDGVESGSTPQRYKRIIGYSSTNIIDFIQQIALINMTGHEGQKGNITFTIPTGVNYIRISCGLIDSEYQLELGTTATDYMPYMQIYTEGTTETVTDDLGNTATAEMLLNVTITNNYTDVQEILTGTITRNTAIKVLDGTENWVVNAGDYNFYRLNSAVNYSGSLVSGFHCTHFEPVSVASTSNNQGIRINSNSLFLRYDNLYTATSENLPLFKQWLATQYLNGTPVILVYPLATSATESVTGQTLTTKAGTNTITATGYLDNLGLEVSYKGT